MVISSIWHHSLRHVICATFSTRVYILWEQNNNPDNMARRKQQILITLPSFQDQGGVSSYYRSICPYLCTDKYDMLLLEIGSTKGRGNRIHNHQTKIFNFITEFILSPHRLIVAPSIDFWNALMDSVILSTMVLNDGVNSLPRMTCVSEKYRLRLFHFLSGVSIAAS